MGTSADAPFLDAAYKLVEYGGKPRIKLSTSKLSLPGRKQVFRQVVDGIASGDVVARHDERLPGKALLQPVMIGGRRRTPAPSLEESRTLCAESVRELPPSLRELKTSVPGYAVSVSERLTALQEECKRELHT
jgi:nicotinate phosphoribosyltransferase